MSAGREVVDQTATAFMTCSQAGDWDGMLALVAEGASGWSSGGRPRQPFADAVKGFGRMREKMGAWSYLDAKRIVSDDSFCEQHVTRFASPDGSTKDYSCCIVATVGEDGLITRLDEYVDPAEQSTWLG